MTATPRADAIAARYGKDHPLHAQMLAHDRQDARDAAVRDARDFPHDEPCPRCGRRQWGLGADVADPLNPTDAEQETCGACGYVYDSPEGTDRP